MDLGGGLYILKVDVKAGLGRCGRRQVCRWSLCVRLFFFIAEQDTLVVDNDSIQGAAGVCQGQRTMKLQCRAGVGDADGLVGRGIRKQLASLKPHILLFLPPR